MTREEAIAYIQEWLKDEYALNSRDRKVLNMAIKALKKGSILDKIKAEIKEKFEECDICEWFVDYDHDGNDISEYMCAGSIDEIIDIIDKYRAESEE